MGPVRQNPIQRTVRSVHMCVWALCTIVVHNTAQNRPDNFPSYPPISMLTILCRPCQHKDNGHPYPDKHTCSVYGTETVQVTPLRRTLASSP